MPAASLSPGPAAEPVYELALPDGTFTITRDEDGAYLIDHAYYGRYAVAAQGAGVQCAPRDHLADWQWQRLMVGQVLPLASLLNGYEPLHASAVRIGDRAVLIMGASGAGKSSVALHLSAGPQNFHADDVCALELRGDAVLAHPGPALTSVDEAELAGMPDALAAGWKRVGRADGEVRLAGSDAGRRDGAPIGAVFVLARRSGVSAVEIGPPAAPVASILIGGTFIAYVQGPGRQVRQLEVAAALAASVPLYEVRMPPGVRASEVAAAIARTHV